MADHIDFDSRARASLSKLSEDLAQLDMAIKGATEGLPLPWPLFEVFLRLTAAAEVCEGVVRDHASAVARVSDATLGEVAATLRLVREVTTALMRIALQATETVN